MIDDVRKNKLEIANPPRKNSRREKKKTRKSDLSEVLGGWATQSFHKFENRFMRLKTWASNTVSTCPVYVQTSTRNSDAVARSRLGLNTRYS